MDTNKCTNCSLILYYASNSKCPIRKLSLCHMSMKFIIESRLTSFNVAGDFNRITRGDMICVNHARRPRKQDGRQNILRRDELLSFKQGSYKTWKSLTLNVLEFENKHSRPWMSLNLWRSKFFLLWFLDIFWNCLTFKTDILLNWFCMFISDKAVWNSLKLRFEQLNVRFYWFLTPFLQYLVLEFADTWPWMSLKSPWIWLFLTCTNPV
jgi:hypothetical protein